MKSDHIHQFWQATRRQGEQARLSNRAEGPREAPSQSQSDPRLSLDSSSDQLRENPRPKVVRKRLLLFTLLSPSGPPKTQLSPREQQQN